MERTVMSKRKFIDVLNLGSFFNVITNFDFLFFCFLVLSGKLGKQSLRFRGSIYFFFVISVFLYQNDLI
jgi:hypothetical protein